MGYRVAVVGATGNVGNEMLQILAERKFPVDEVVALASERSTGKEVSFGEERTLKVQDLATFDFRGLRHRPVLAGRQGLGRVRAQGRGRRLRGDRQHLALPHGPRRAAGGAGGQPRCARRASTRRTSSPTRTARPSRWSWRSSRCTTSPRSSAWWSATYQSVSGAGREAMDELFEHTKAIFMNDRKEPEFFKKPIPFNVIPQIDVFLEDGADQGGVEDGGRDQEDPRPQDPCRRDLRARAGVRRPRRGGQRRVREPARPRRGARGAARGRGRGGGRRPRASSSRRRMRRRVCRVRLADPQRPDRALRPEPVGGLGQSAQGCGAERDPDRRGHGRGRRSSDARRGSGHGRQARRLPSGCWSSRWPAAPAPLPAPHAARPRRSSRNCARRWPPARGAGGGGSGVPGRRRAPKPAADRAAIGALLDLDPDVVVAGYCARMVAGFARGDLGYADFVALSEGSTDPELLRRFVRSLRWTRARSRSEPSPGRCARRGPAPTAQSPPEQRPRPD